MPILAVFLQLAFSSGTSDLPAEFRYPADRERLAVELRSRTHVLHFLEAGAGLAVLAFLVHRGVFRKEPRRRAAAVAVSAVTLGALAAVQLPFAAYRHELAVRYGLSVQSWPSWAADWGKAQAIGIAVGLPLIVGAFAAARRTRRWWLFVWAGTVAFSVAGALVVPWLIDPLFHRFRPLAGSRPDLVEPLQRVAARAGLDIPPERMFIMEASEKTRAVNAYLTGFGPSKRIVLWDTTLDTLRPEQIQTVFAHETGHYALLHIPKGLALASAAMLMLFYGLHRFLGRRASDPAAIPEALLLLLATAFLAEPLVNSYSRLIEREADLFELRTMSALVPNAGRISAGVEVEMAARNLEHPRPSAFIRWWLYDHPPTAERVRRALTFAGERVAP